MQVGAAKFNSAGPPAASPAAPSFPPASPATPGGPPLHRCDRGRREPHAGGRRHGRGLAAVSGVRGAAWLHAPALPACQPCPVRLPFPPLSPLTPSRPRCSAPPLPQPPHRAGGLHGGAPGVPAHQHARAGVLPAAPPAHRLAHAYHHCGRHACRTLMRSAVLRPCGCHLLCPTSPPPVPAPADAGVVRRGRRAGAGRGAAPHAGRVWRGGAGHGGGGGEGAA